MRKIFVLLILIFISCGTESFAYGDQPLSKEDMELFQTLAKKFACPDNYDSQKSCIEKDVVPEDSSKFVKTYISEYEIIDVIQLYAYQGSDTLFLKHGNKLYPLKTLMNAGFDKKNLVFYSYTKGRGIGDIGTAEFYKLALTDKELKKFKTFSTDQKTINEDKITYIDEKGKKDEEMGFSNRADEYIKKNGFKFE